MPIAIPATCMYCGQWTDCVRIADIGWVCWHCRAELRGDGDSYEKAAEARWGKKDAK